ncbi:iron-dependent peroxidase [Ignatzschineria indica]|uniref:Dyp-type peroxidase n=1 Tax=Ignatzschineria indica TaxID=472583 RepID=A0A2U2AP72_9GAMM|nr:MULTISPECIES: Dyp-type peroxidase [Ignatzschineria]OYQ81168.1 peroxidase [Ignatzschineria sp. F8392]PWD85010.1 Dyp-type peroxidase [Ignatzschineria indica]GGZ80824.1 iron-dependent peroxidase [Ignatzschineria indica]
MSELNFQEGLVVENRDHAIFMEINFKSDDLDAIKDAIAGLLARQRSYTSRFDKSGLQIVVAFGREAWTALSENGKSAPELVDFRELGYGMAKATQRDMFVHINSHSHRINFSVAQDLVKIFGDLITVEEEVHGFRWIEARDLGGFVDGTENPKGLKDRTEVAVINEGIDAGGSYVIAQKWVHSLEQINHFDLKTQEDIFGRTKVEDIEMDDDEKPVGAHTERVVIDEDGEELEIVRHSLPYGYASGEKGLYFLAYSAELTRYEKMLARMFGEEDEHFDRMLSYTHAVTGSFLYAPSLDQLEEIGAA